MQQSNQRPLSTEEFSILVDRAGLDLTPTELAELRAAFEPMREQLEQLHSLDLGMRDPAVEFDPIHVKRGD